MIRINLIPQAKRPLEKIPTPLLAVVGVAGLSFLAAFGLSFYLYSSLSDKQQDVEAIKGKAASYTERIMVVKGKDEELSAIKQEVASISQVAERLVFWNEITYEICKLASMVEGLSITEIDVLDDKQISTEYRVIDPQAKKGPNFGIKIVANAFDRDPATILRFRRLLVNSEMLQKIVPIINDKVEWKEKRAGMSEAASLEFTVYLFAEMPKETQ